MAGPSKPDLPASSDSDSEVSNSGSDMEVEFLPSKHAEVIDDLKEQNPPVVEAIA